MQLFLFILISTIVYMLLGMLWYGPLFGEPWMKLNGFSKKTLDKSNMGQILSLTFVSALLMFTVFGYILMISSTHFASVNLFKAIIIWAGLIFVPAFVNSMYVKKPIKLVLIDTTYFLVALLISTVLYMIITPNYGMWRFNRMHDEYRNGYKSNYMHMDREYERYNINKK